MIAEEALQAVLAVVCRVRTVAKDCAKMLGEDMPLRSPIPSKTETGFVMRGMNWSQGFLPVSTDTGLAG